MYSCEPLINIYPLNGGIAIKENMFFDNESAEKCRFDEIESIGLE